MQIYCSLTLICQDSRWISMNLWNSQRYIFHEMWLTLWVSSKFSFFEKSMTPGSWVWRCHRCRCHSRKMSCDTFFQHAITMRKRYIFGIYLYGRLHQNVNNDGHPIAMISISFTWKYKQIFEGDLLRQGVTNVELLWHVTPFKSMTPGVMPFFKKNEKN